MRVNTISDGRQLIRTIDGALSPDECRDMIETTEARGYGDAPITTARGFVMRRDVRNNTRVIWDNHELAARLWERLAAFVPTELGAFQAIGLNERFRFYRYDPGQFFRWHFDGAFHRSPVEQSLLTAMVYLNEDFEGGSTDFDVCEDEAVSIEPREGMALVFTHAQMHQGAPATRGRKYVMRTDVMYRRDETSGVCEA